VAWAISKFVDFSHEDVAMEAEKQIDEEVLSARVRLERAASHAHLPGHGGAHFGVHRATSFGGEDHTAQNCDFCLCFDALRIG
jgi:hypothetical protein